MADLTGAKVLIHQDDAEMLKQPAKNFSAMMGAQYRFKGEVATLECCKQAYIVRTGWVYAEHGHNFVKTMLRLAKERNELNVVADQIGTPTYAVNLAKMIWRLIEVEPQQRIYHFSDAGVASWYDFSKAIFKEAKALGLIQKEPLVIPIASSDYPTPAKRPSFSVLDKELTWSEIGIEPIYWRDALVEMLKQIKKNIDEQ